MPEDNAADLYIEGQRLYDLGQFEQALACFLRAAELAPAYALCWYAVGNAASACGEYETAMRALQRAIELDPPALTDESERARIYANLALCSARLGETKAAEAAIKTALALGPKEAGVHCCVGFAYEALEDLPRALAHLQRAVELDPTDLDALKEVAWVLQTLGDYHGAIDYARRAIALADQSLAARLYGILAFCSASLGEAVDCDVACQTALELGPEVAWVHLYVGLAYHALSDDARALPHLRRASELDPSNEEIRQVLENAEAEPGRAQRRRKWFRPRKAR